MRDPRQIITPGSEPPGLTTALLEHGMCTAQSLASSVHAELRYIEGHTKGQEHFAAAAGAFLKSIGGVIVRRYAEIRYPTAQSPRAAYVAAAEQLVAAAHIQDKHAEAEQTAAGPGDTKPKRNPPPYEESEHSPEAP